MSKSINDAATPDLAAIVAANTGLVVGLAKEFRGRGVPLEDLVSEGRVGLVEAARRFDDARGAKFTTYAGWWIRKRILKAVAEQPRLVRVSAYRRKLERLHPAAEGPARVRMVGIDDAPGRDRRSIGDSLSAPGDGAETSLLHDEVIGLVRDRLARLHPAERRVLSLRYGLDDGPGMTLREAGLRLGVSRERVRQIEVRAIERLRRALVSRHPRRTRGAA